MTIPTRIEAMTGPSRGYELNDGTNLPDGWVGHCNDCVQPISDHSRFERARAWLAYHVVMLLPMHRSWGYRLAMPLLPFAGQWAFECGCSNRAACLSAQEST